MPRQRLAFLLLLIALLSVLSACAGLQQSISLPPAVVQAARATAAPAAVTVTFPTPTPTTPPTAAPTSPPTVPPPTVPPPTPTAVPPTPAPTAAGFPVGNELTIAALLERPIAGSAITIEQPLESGANYARYVASYVSEGNKIYGLLTVPFGDPPEGGFKAIVFNHGYIPPDQYVTTERYVAYVDALARAGGVLLLARLHD